MKIPVICIVGLISFSAYSDTVDLYHQMFQETSYNFGSSSEGLTKRLNEFENGSVEINCLFSNVIHRGRSKIPNEYDGWKSADKGFENHCERRFNAITAFLNKDAAPTERGRDEIKESGIFHKGMSCKRSHDVNTVINEGCEKVIDAIIQKSSQKETAIAIDSNDYLFQPDEHQSLEDRKKLIRDYVASSLIKKCEVDGPDSISCQTKNVVGQKITAINAQKEKVIADRLAEEKRLKDLVNEEENKKNSPEVIKERACEAYKAVKLADDSMKFQREVGEESGFVDKAALHNLGTMKIINKKELENLKKEYKDKTGNEISLNNCK